MSPRWRRRLYVLLFLAAAFLLGSTAQEQLGVSFTVEGLQAFRQWVQSLGWWGPAVFILLVVFRLFIGLSSHLVLILGGLVFVLPLLSPRVRDWVRGGRGASAQR